jgi:hypothetical protein
VPSKGNPKITVRATPALIAEIEEECKKLARGANAEPLTTTEFVLASIREKLAHLRRARKARLQAKNARALSAVD